MLARTARTGPFTTTKTHRQASPTTRPCINTPIRPRGIGSLKGILHGFSGTLPHETPPPIFAIAFHCRRRHAAFSPFFPSAIHEATRHPSREAWEIAMTTTTVGWRKTRTRVGGSRSVKKRPRQIRLPPRRARPGRLLDPYQSCSPLSPPPDAPLPRPR